MGGRRLIKLAHTLKYCTTLNKKTPSFFAFIIILVEFFWSLCNRRVLLQFPHHDSVRLLSSVWKINVTHKAKKMTCHIAAGPPTWREPVEVRPWHTHAHAQVDDGVLQLPESLLVNTGLLCIIILLLASLLNGCLVKGALDKGLATSCWPTFCPWDVWLQQSDEVWTWQHSRLWQVPALAHESVSWKVVPLSWRLSHSHCVMCAWFHASTNVNGNGGGCCVKCPPHLICPIQRAELWAVLMLSLAVKAARNKCVVVSYEGPGCV